MTRPLLAIVLFVVFTGTGFGWRTLVQVRRHGDSGWRFTRTGPDRLVGAALVLAFVLVGAGPMVALVGGTPVVGGAPATVVGAALTLGAGVLTVVAQAQMGASWRIGVEAGERTDLVTHGLFGLVRNPIFTGMVLFVTGLVVLVPTWPGVVGAVLATLTIQLQVRLVEEPNLVAVHGEPYRRWAASTGRFLPGLGRDL